MSKDEKKDEELIGTEVEELFFEFLNSFEVDISTEKPSYCSEIKAMVPNVPNTMHIDFADVMLDNSNLEKRIVNEFLRFEPYLSNACKTFVSTWDDDDTVSGDNNPKFDVNVAFYNVPVVKRVRELSCSELGKLVSVIGVVTHTSEVQPELLQGTFKCLICNTEYANRIEQQLQYTEPPICKKPLCQNTAKWAILTEKSKFADSQMVRMQEISKDIPAGSLPRSLDVIIRHDNVEQTRAGDTVIFTGAVVVIPEKLQLAPLGERVVCLRGASQRRNDKGGQQGVQGRRALGVRELSYRLAFLANSVRKYDDQISHDIRNSRRDVDEDENPQFTHEELDDILRMRDTPDFFDKLVDSVAPAVLGHRDIKRGILLMLMGGVHKSTHEGINLRGSINVCIVGDPGCAKSQFLKYTSALVPRSVYTSGKSSSAAGLTASVAKERETGEFRIQAGALMLADNSICCIDDFDKIDVRDQVAIYEAMEQQTISLTKAGVQATLNARTSVLAAANHSRGSYDRTKSLKYNVALPRALLSRFDLVYVMIDEANDQADLKIAQHIVRARQKRDNPVDPHFSTAQMKLIIKYAKTLEPKITQDAREELVDSYVGLRRDGTAQGSKVVFCPTTRQLEALIRLSEAITRSHLVVQVQRDHVKMAKELLKTSVISVESSEIDLSEFQEKNHKGGVGDKNGTGQGEDQPTGAPAESVSGNAGNGAGTSNKQGEKLIVTEEYQDSVILALIQRLREHEETVKQGEALAGMRQEELIRWYVDQQNQKKKYSSLEELKAEVEKVSAIIQEVIERQGKLIVISDGRPEGEDSGTKSTSRNDRILVVSPSYTADLK